MPKLFMLLIGCRPPGRHVEQHDIFFGIAETIKDLIPGIIKFWPEAKGQLHIDGWRIVSNVDGHSVSIILKSETFVNINSGKLFFINLGGYKPNEFEEFHYKMIVAAPTKNEAIRQSKKTAFFKHIGFKGAAAHIDDKYGIDVDDVYDVREILSETDRGKYTIIVQPSAAQVQEDEMHLGYFKLSSFA